MSKPYLHSNISTAAIYYHLGMCGIDFLFQFGFTSRLEESEYKYKLSLCYSIVDYYNGAQRYKQSLQVSWLYRALILLGLALSSKHLCVFGLRGAIY